MNIEAARPYRMVARAESAAATGERILDAAVALFWDEPTDSIPLDDVAARAGVSVRTVIRRFGGVEGLTTAAVAREAERVSTARDRAVAGDTRQAIAVLVDHYEELGDAVLRMLAVERRMPGLTPIVEAGRVVHRRWCERVFAATLADLRGPRRARRLASLTAICDVNTWALLRRHSGLSRRQTEQALLEMVTPLLEAR